MIFNSNIIKFEIPFFYHDPGSTESVFCKDERQTQDPSVTFRKLMFMEKPLFGL